MIRGDAPMKRTTRMATQTPSDARLNFRLPTEFKQTIEDAAALTGQTVSDFAISELLVSARRVIQDHDRTVLSNRDRDIFLAMLEDTDARPNAALVAAAKRYKERRK
jgi:uncharacterized protein (DUF1778 family)